MSEYLAALLLASGMALASFSGTAAAAAPAEPGVLQIGVGHPLTRNGARLGTPETVETMLAHDLGQRLQRPVVLQSVDADLRWAKREASQLDFIVAARGDEFRTPSGVTAVETGYTVAPMAILRSDTDITVWEQLSGRKVCVVDGGRYVGHAEAAYRAQEVVFGSLTDALLELRTGGCDAMVHDDSVLKQLLILPEWKKFSARLESGVRTSILIAAAVNDRKRHSWIRKVAAEWQKTSHSDQRLAAMVKQIAFEVYLQQDVPDCH